MRLNNFEKSQNLGSDLHFFSLIFNKIKLFSKKIAEK